MEKRFTLFLLLSGAILFGHLMLQRAMFPPQPDNGVADGPDQLEDDPGPADGKQAPNGDDPPTAETPDDDEPAEPDEPTAQKPDNTTPDGPANEALPATVPNQRIAIGSMAPNSPFRLLVTAHNRGAAIERIELAQRKPDGAYLYQDLEAKSGYLGHMALSDEPTGDGCRINVVGSGTPAALAVSSDSTVEAGLKQDDIIRQVDGQLVPSVLDFYDTMELTQPDQTVEFTVDRALSESETQSLVFAATLTDYPLSIIRPEWNSDSELMLQEPLSCLMTLDSVDDRTVPRGALEIPGIKKSLRDSNWEAKTLEDAGEGPGVEFSLPLSEADLGAKGALEIVKRYRLARIPQGQEQETTCRAYHLTLEIEIRNTGEADQQIAYRLDGPNGLPLEGWWYSNKIHPKMFKGAGARDVVFHTPNSGHVLIGCPRIYSDAKKAEEKDQPPLIPLFVKDEPQPLDYIGIDCQYFSVVMKPGGVDAEENVFAHAYAMPAGDVGEKKKRRIRTTNSTFQLISQSEQIKPGESIRETFELFAGPKQPKLLENYGLVRCVEYGWFPMIAKPLQWILHFFESLPLVNFGLAIILLTVVVRSGMIPFSRKAAKNAQMMQQLAPEMKKIAEKYKDDMQKRSVAQRELFAKHNHKPLGGCLLMFIQLPIFIGLYRALSVDIELRQAPLINGLSWCSNLTSPDMLWYWQPFVWDAIGSESGWLGPYFNVLPIFTIVLFLAQQKMFMPPATDEQTRMQQQMMKFMMVFMGVLFFKVASGLCVYFIASSLWGIAERKLLPPVGKKPDPTTKPSEKTTAEIEAKKARLKGKKKPKHS